MASRLALVDCTVDKQGPWTRAKGNEYALEIFGLHEGESISFEYDVAGVSNSITYAEAGTHLLPHGIAIERYRVCKQVNDYSLAGPTTVKVALKF